jgi:ECF transporter S component (folate family)
MSSLKRTKILTTAALFLAVCVILSFLSIPITSVIEIRFNGLAIGAAGAVLGPVLGTVIGAVADILGYLVKPTGAFFPGFTISYALTGLIYGLLLHRDKSLRNIIAAQILVTVIINIGLNTLWLSMLYGNAYKALLLMRLPKECVMLPINIILMTLIMKPLERISISGRPAVH